MRAGRSLVLTTHAETLRDRVQRITQDAIAVLRPDADALDPRSLERAFTIRANDGFVEAVGAKLVAEARARAPGVRLRFTPKPDKDVRALRDGVVDLEIGVLGDSGPEIRIQTLFHDRFVGVVRQGHPLLKAEVTPRRYAACDHVVASRRGTTGGPVDRALATLGLSRAVIAVVPSFSAALALATDSDLVALLPQSFAAARLRHPGTQTAVAIFDLPLTVEGITVSQMWHPRLDADAGHRWLRGLMLKATTGEP